tara:strand:- start:24056 stop:24979 length:924 start_codon:yes stop_codon:yes gene_type:complete
MKTITQIKNILVVSAILAITFSACSSVNNDTEALSEEDIAIATEIVAVTLADNESGVISSMYDAFSGVDDSGISYGDFQQGRAKAKRRNHNSGRGGERNYTHSYDSTTGVHIISYDRAVENETYSKSVSLNQEIIFTDLDGGFIARPKAEKNAIEAISFSGTKTGEAEGPFRSSSFTKEDDFEISGIHATSGTLSMAGTHHGIGEAEGQLSDSTTSSRAYEINISFENVAIVKDTVLAYGSLEQGVSGTLTYSIQMNKTINGVPEETLVEGTIDLEEDGTALLRFNKLPKVIRFSLVDGESDDRPRR